MPSDPIPFPNPDESAMDDYLTKRAQRERQLLASEILCRLLCNPANSLRALSRDAAEGNQTPHEYLADVAVKHADALLARLEKTESAD